MTVTVPKRTNRLGFLLPGCLAAGTALLVCLAPETPQDPVIASDVAALTRIQACDRFGGPTGVPGWSAIVLDDDRDSPDDDDDDSPDRDGPSAVVPSQPRSEGGDYSVAHDSATVVALYVADSDVPALRGPPASTSSDQCSSSSQQRFANTQYWSAGTRGDDSPDSSDDDDDDDDDDGPDALTSTASACADSSTHVRSDAPCALGVSIQRASRTHSLRAPPQ